MRKNIVAVLLGLLALLLTFAGPASAADESLVVTVKEGTSVRDLAGEYLNDPDLWKEILRVNDLRSASDVKPGVRLKLPANAISRAALALARSQERIAEANGAGAQLFATDQVTRAADLRNQALTRRRAGAWDECRQLAQQSEDAAAEALRKSRSQRNVAAEAILQAVRGTVQSRKITDADWRNAPLNAVLVEGQRLRTLSSSSAEVRFRDGTRLRLESNAQALIQKMRVNSLEGREEASVSLVEGDASALLDGSRSNKRSFSLQLGHTQQAHVNVKSSNFWVSRTKTQTRFANYDGELEVKTKEGTVVIGKNQGVLVEQDKAPTLQKKLLPASVLTRPARETSFFRNTVTLAWEATPGASSYWLEVAKDDGFRTLLTSVKDLASPELPLKNLEDGAYYWRVSAIDQDGFPGPKSDAWRFTVVRDAQPPHLFVLAPADRVTVRQPELVLEGETERGATVTLDGSALAVEPEGRFRATVTLRPGPQTLVLTATDPAGNAQTLRRAVTFRPPQRLTAAYAESLPRRGERHFLAPGEGFTLAARTEPDAWVEVRSEAGEPVARAVADDKGDFAVSLSVPGPRAGFVLALGTAHGDQGEDRFEVELDRDPPELQLQQEPPEVSLSPTLRLEGTARGATRATFNGQPLALRDGRFELSVDLRPGANPLQLWAVDEVGNSASLERTVVLDREGPELLSHALSQRTAQSGERLAVRVAAQDASGLRASARYVVEVGPQRFTGHLRLSRATRSYDGVFVIPPAARGQVRLRQVTLEDQYGNQRDYHLQ